MGVEDGKKCHCLKGGGKQRDAAVKQPRAEDVQQADRERAQECNDRARDLVLLGGMQGGGAGDVGIAAVPQGEHDVQQICQRRRIGEIVWIQPQPCHLDRVRDEMGALVEVVDVGQPLPNPPEAQHERHGEHACQHEAHWQGPPVSRSHGERGRRRRVAVAAVAPWQSGPWRRGVRLRDSAGLRRGQALSSWHTQRSTGRRRCA